MTENLTNKEYSLRELYPIYLRTLGALAYSVLYQDSHHEAYKDRLEEIEQKIKENLE